MAANTVIELANLRVAQWLAEERTRKDVSLPASRPEIAPEQRVITISRQYGARGHSIADCVAQRLGPDWEIWDREIVDEVAKRANVRSALVSAFDEHSISPEEEILRYLTNSWKMSPETYFRHLVQVLLAISRQGNKIIVGRGSSFVLKNALHIRLCASDTYRIKAIMDGEKLSEEDARARMAKVEIERSRFVKSFFHHNVNDLADYDMVIHVDRVGLDAAAAAIAAAMEARCAAAGH